MNRKVIGTASLLALLALSACEVNTAPIPAATIAAPAPVLVAPAPATAPGTVIVQPRAY